MNVIFLLMAMMVIVGILKKTGLFQWMAYKSYEVTRGNLFLLVSVLMLVTGFISALLDNVTTMLLIIPVSVEIALALRLDPLKLLVPEAFASNVGGTATLIGDPPNIMLGSYAQLSFLDFCRHLTVICAICLVVGILYFVWRIRREYSKPRAGSFSKMVERLRAEYKITDRRLVSRGLVILGVTVLLFIVHGLLGMPPCVAAMAGAALLMVVGKVDIVEMLEHEIEWPTLIFFAMLFVVVGGAQETGLIDIVAEWVRNIAGGSLVVAVLVIFWVSAISSSLVDNIPFTATMLPVVAQLSGVLNGGHGGVLWWALALGACLGGNATMIGASANVITVGIAERAGYGISFTRYFKMVAVPTLLTLVLSMVWLLAVEM
jgi:Na+/H+ antiporter NhaD/arsenite permease-like protein